MITRSATFLAVCMSCVTMMLVTGENMDSTMESIRGAGNSITGLVGDLRTVIGIEPINPNGPEAYLPRTTNPNSFAANASPSGQATTVGYSLPGSRPTTLVQQSPTLPGTLVSPQNRRTFAELMGQASATLDEAQGTFRDIRSLMNSPGVQASLEKVPRVLNEVTQTLQIAGDTLESFNKVGGRFEQVGVVAEKTIQDIDDAVKTATKTIQSLEKTFANIEKFTEPLGERGGELIEHVMNSLASLDGALIEVKQFGAMINNSDGTIRRLIDDDELYFRVVRILENAEEASARLRPILNDVRVFTDKIARDPRQIGVRGALNNRPSGLGFK